MKRRLQIFVSGTFTDLINERQSAVAAILKAGHIPAGMELFTAGDTSQWITIQRWIDESDGYMLILGGRYGSIEPKTGISYTELEYDYAVQQNKPLFAVVIDNNYLKEKLRVNGSKVIERDNVRELELFRKKVLLNISSFFRDDKDIRLCVHESLAELNSNLSVKGWVSAVGIEDAKPLHEEINRLRSENSRLLTANKKSGSIENIGENALNYNLDETIDDIKGILVKIPNEMLRDTVKREYTLLEMFIAFRDHLVLGVTNRSDISDQESFLYFNICPKLKIYGLTGNEKVSGAIRRSFVSTRGITLLAQVQRRIKNGKSIKAKSNSKNSAIEPPAKSKEKTTRAPKKL